MKKTKEQGFTLIEIILVLALIGAVAGVIIPNLTLSIDSQMSSSLRSLTGQIRSAYDDAIFTGRLHRMVFDMKTGEYWVEQAPLGFEGRPPLIESGTETDALLKRDKRNDLIKLLDAKAKNGSDRQMLTSTSTNTKYYSLRSIPVVQRKILRPIDWIEIDDSVIYRQKLPDRIIFAHISSMISYKTFNYVDIFSSNEKGFKAFSYIYFLPNGTATPTSIKLAMRQDSNKGAIDDEGLKYTINLNTLTGESRLLEGFQDANFTLPKK
jgi:prepilin-type N-terminal cleavage/methylation domain-containing protein